MATLHLIHGYIGAGKTTFAKKLEVEKDAVRFSADECMFDLYGANPPADKYNEYETALKNMISVLTTKLLNKNIDVILDYGFWTKSERQKAKEFAKSLNVETILYKLQCDDEIAWQRVHNRSMDISELNIDKNAYDNLKQYFEPLSDDEECITAP